MRRRVKSCDPVIHTVENLPAQAVRARHSAGEALTMRDLNATLLNSSASPIGGRVLKGVLHA
jgi:hypothetical protein